MKYSINKLHMNVPIAYFILIFSLLCAFSAYSKEIEWEIEFDGNAVRENAHNQEIITRLRGLIYLYPAGKEPHLTFYFHDKKNMAQRWKNLTRFVPELRDFQPIVFNHPKANLLSIRLQTSPHMPEPCPAVVRIIDPQLPIDRNGMLVHGSLTLSLSQAAQMEIEEEKMPIRIVQLQDSNDMIVLNSQDKKWTLHADHFNNDLLLEVDNVALASLKDVSLNAINKRNLPQATHRTCRLQFQLFQ